MTRYRISGIDSDSGLDTELTVEARDERHARMLAATNGIEHAVVLPVDVLPEVCPIETIVRPRKRKRWLVGAAIFVVAGLTAGGGLWGWQSNEGQDRSAASASKNSFRGIEWGASLQTARKLERAMLVEESNDALMYSTNLADLQTNIIYIFADNQLVRAKYIITQWHNNKNDYITDYNKLSDLLQEKYGPPFIDEIKWKTATHSDDPQTYGMEIATGNLIMYKQWWGNVVVIHLQLSGDGYSCDLQIEYTSVELMDLNNEHTKKRNLDGL